MTVEWKARRWPGWIHLLLRLCRVPGADQGVLVIQTDPPAALGRMTLEDRDGKALYALIDSSRNRKKKFYLPASMEEAGFVLKNEAGAVLFSLGAGSPDGKTDGEKATAETAAAEDTSTPAAAAPPEDAPPPPRADKTTEIGHTDSRETSSAGTDTEKGAKES